MSPYGPAATPQARQAADAVKAKLLDGSFTIFKGPLKDNAGKIVRAWRVTSRTQMALALSVLTPSVVG